MTDSADQPNGAFVSSKPLDNLYQTSSWLPMPFALVTTIDDSGQTNIGPHALICPFGITAPHSMLLISRGNSGTAHNLRTRGKCALNFIEFNEALLHSVADLGYPGKSAEEKQRDNAFSFVDSPAYKVQFDPARPQVIAAAFQVYECTWDQSISLPSPVVPEGMTGEARFVLNIDNILLRERFRATPQEAPAYPSFPIFFGYRGGQFLFARHEPPFAITPTTGADTTVQNVIYLANRLDPHVRFTDDACRRLTAIPKPFLEQALLEIIKQANTAGITHIDEQALNAISAARKHS